MAVLFQHALNEQKRKHSEKDEMDYFIWFEKLIKIRNTGHKASWEKRKE